MAEETDLIKDQITETKNHLAENLVSLEHRVKDSVDKVRAKVQQINPKYQTQEHPFWMLGASVALGVLASSLIFRRRRPTASGYAGDVFQQGIDTARRGLSTAKRSVWEPLSGELGDLRHAAGTAIAMAIGDVARHSLPKLQNQMDRMFQNVGKKLEGSSQKILRVRTA